MAKSLSKSTRFRLFLIPLHPKVMHISNVSRLRGTPNRTYSSSSPWRGYKSKRSFLVGVTRCKKHTIIAGEAVQYDRMKELRAFDDTKAGVKGLVDAPCKMVNIPNIFVRPPYELAYELSRGRTKLQVPTIDLKAIGKASDQRKIVVEEIQRASEKWGFFQVVNHGIPKSVLDNMLHGVRMFHEQDLEVKREYYSRDQDKMVKYNSNYDLYKSRAANWRDTFSVSLQRYPLDDTNDIPSVCRDATVDYINHVTEFGDTVFELLSEALGLEPDHLKEQECARGPSFVCHYYPACPEPDRTMGITKHTDKAFLTLVLQDQIGGLQVLHEDQWADVQPIPGALVINIGDLLQMITNDKFKSVIHRVLANGVGPRVSVACFFGGVFTPKIYAPIQKLVSKENPPIFREFTIREYVSHFYSVPLDEKSGLNYFRL